MGRQEKAPKKSIDGIWVGLAPAPSPHERAPPSTLCCMLRFSCRNLSDHVISFPLPFNPLSAYYFFA